jgi:hypothetical protein
MIIAEGELTKKQQIKLYRCLKRYAIPYYL